MALRLNYTNRDYDSVLADLRSKIPDITDQWNDFLESDLGYALIKTFAAIADHSSFYLDRQAAENYLDTCEQRDSAVSYAKALGYNPISISAATVSVRFAMFSVYNETVAIPKGTVISIEGKTFHTTAEALIVSGSLETLALCKQGSRFVLNQTSSGASWIKMSLPANLTDVEVKVEGTLWDRTDSFIYPVSKTSYRLYEDRSSKVVMFGGGANTTVPAVGSAIEVAGVVCDGITGNTKTSLAAVTILTPIYNSHSQDISNLLSGVTTSTASGGANAESIASIKNNAPAFYTTQNRAVTASDYTAIASAVPGVTEATAWGGEEVNRYGEVFICISGVDSSNVPPSLINAVSTAIASKHMIPIIVNVVAPKLVRVNLTVDAYIPQPYELATGRTIVESRISSFFNNVKTGEMFQHSDFSSNVANAAQIDYLNFEATCVATGTIQSNRIICTLINYPIETSIVVSRGGVVYWTHTTSEYTIRNNVFEATIPGALYADGMVDVQISSQYKDIYAVREQKLILGSLTSSIFRSKVPQ